MDWNICGTVAWITAHAGVFFFPEDGPKAKERFLYGKRVFDVLRGRAFCRRFLASYLWEDLASTRREGRIDVKMMKKEGKNENIHRISGKGTGNRGIRTTVGQDKEAGVKDTRNKETGPAGFGETDRAAMQDGSDYEKTAMKVSAVSIVANAVLTVLKLLAGVFARSGAMISDAIHSASDVFSTIVVIVGVKISGRESDKDHPYGHERLECVAAIVLATILAATGLGIGYSAVGKITGGESAGLAAPGIAALVAAVVSIVVKEAMYQYTKVYAKRIDSGALMADAWHHRSDALSSVGALVGIAGARMGFPILDPVASVVICVFIEKAAYEIFMDAVDKMVDKACSDEVEEVLRRCALEQEGVLGVDLLQTRVFGNKIYVDIEICVDGEKKLKEAHGIAEGVHDAIERTFPKVKHIMVHVNPA